MPIGVPRRLHRTRNDKPLQKKVFWIVFLSLSLAADLVLPLLWGLLATMPLVLLSWWIAYRSGWFE